MSIGCLAPNSDPNNEVPAMSIHPLALVSPQAVLGANVQIGPLSIVEAGVAIGSGCILESHVVIKSGTTLGENCRVFDGAILGGMPQHVHMPEKPGKVVIGSHNAIRENVTIHRAWPSDPRRSSATTAC